MIQFYKIKNSVIRCCVKHKGKLICGSKIVSYSLFVSILLTGLLFLNREGSIECRYAEKRIDKIYNEFDNFCNQYFQSKGDNKHDIVSQYNKIFDRYNSDLLIFSNGELHFLSDNIYKSKRDIKTLCNKAGKVIEDSNSLFIPLYRNCEDQGAMLFINLSNKLSEKSECDEFIRHNSAIICSPKADIIPFNGSLNSVYAPTGEPLFSFGENSIYYNCGSVNIILLFEFLALLLVLRLINYRKILDYRDTIKRFSYSFITILTLILIIDVVELTNNFFLLMSIFLLFYSNILYDLSYKASFILNYKSNGVHILKVLDVVLLFVSTVFLSFALFESFNSCGCNLFLKLIPIMLFSSSITVLLISGNLCEVKQFSKKELLITFLITIASILSLFLVDIQLGLIFGVLVVAILLLITFEKRLSNFQIFFILFMLVSIISTLKLTLLNSEQLISENLSIRCSSNSLPFYSNFLDSSGYNFAKLSLFDKLNRVLAIFFYVALVLYGLGLILLNRRVLLIGYKKVNINGKIPIMFYISVLALILGVTYISKVFIANIEEDSTENYVKHLFNNINSDLKNSRYNSDDLIGWIKKVNNIYCVDIELYDYNGTLLFTSEANSKKDEMIPLQLGSRIVERLHRYPTENHICSESYFSLFDYSSVYSVTSNNLILRLPFNSAYLSSKSVSYVVIFVNGFIILLLLLLLGLVNNYLRNTRPLFALQHNIKSIKQRRRVLIDPIIKSSSALSSVVLEYNKMLHELRDQHELELEIERQTTRNIISKTLVHEIKNPLTPILLMSELSLKMLRDNDPRWRDVVERRLHTIIEQTHRISNIVSKIMIDCDTSRTKALNVDIVGLLRNISLLFGAYENIEIRLENMINSERVEIDIDYDNIWSVISNITLNGIDAINEIGDNKGLIVYKLYIYEGDVCISIINNGSPIPKENFETIFDYKYTTKISGNGLGLYLSDRIIKESGGKIYVSCSDKDFTEIVIKIPLSRVK